MSWDSNFVIDKLKKEKCVSIIDELFLNVILIQLLTGRGSYPRYVRIKNN